MWQVVPGSTGREVLQEASGRDIIAQHTDQCTRETMGGDDAYASDSTNEVRAGEFTHQLPSAIG